VTVAATFPGFRYSVGIGARPSCPGCGRPLDECPDCGRPYLPSYPQFVDPFSVPYTVPQPWFPPTWEPIWRVPLNPWEGQIICQAGATC
jgi:hypothetical protein